MSSGLCFRPSRQFSVDMLIFRRALKCALFERSNQNVHENQYSTRISKVKYNTLLLIGLCQFENVKSETLFNSIKNALGRMDIPLMDCKVQCYDRVSNMVGAKTGIATRIKEIESRAHLTHCHNHALQIDTAPENSGDRILCQNRWAARGASLQSILGSWAVF